MSGSLIVGPYDLLNPASPAILLGLAGTDLGSGTPDVTTVSRILLDGDVVAGARTGNRQLKLVVLVQSTGNEQIIADITNAVNQQTWAMPWTPDTGKPTVVFDCFRGHVTRDWDQYLDSVTLTLTIPALPFTRDVNPINLGASAAAVVTINSGDSTTGLVGSLPTTYQEYRPNIPEPTYTGLLPNVYATDTTTHISGSGSIRVTTPVYHENSSDFATDANPLVFHFLQGSLAAATDLTGMQTLMWSALSDAGMLASSGSTVRVFPTAPSQAEFDIFNHPFAGATWVVTLIDSSGRKSRWDLTGQGIATSWTSFSVNISATPTAVGAGFDITSVTGWRLRYANLYQNAAAGTLPTLELLPGSQSVATNPLNVTNSGSNYTATAAGTAEVSVSTAVPVTVGASYALAADIGSYYAITMQIGLEWLDSTGTPLPTTWSAVTTGATNINNPVTQTGVAPTGAVTVRARYRWLGASAGNPLYISGSFGVSNPQQLTPQPVHLNAGTVCYSYPYLAVPAAVLWVDNIVAYPAGSGTPLTTSYALQSFIGIKGAARTPVSIAINAAGGAAPTRVLVARTPNPATGFTPFLDVPTSVMEGIAQTSTSDSTALTGKYWKLNGYIQGGGTATTATYTFPAAAYGSTYAIMARMKRPSLVAVTPTVTAALVGDTVNTSTTGRLFGTTGQDATTWPAATWGLLTLGTLTLPPRALSGSNTNQQMTLSVTIPDKTANTTTYLDMLVLVDLAGEMVLIDAPTGNQWVWFDAPSSTAYTGSVFGGSVSTRSDALSLTPWQSGQAVINFDPGANSLTVVADQSPSGGTVNLSYYPRWTGEKPPDRVLVATTPSAYPGALYPGTTYPSP